MSVKKALMVDAGADSMIFDGVVCGIIATIVVLVSVVYESPIGTLATAVVCYAITMSVFYALGRRTTLINHAQFWRRGLTILIVTGIVVAYQLV